MKKMRTVLLTKYPERIQVFANSDDEAISKAKSKVDYSIWEAEVEQ
jgi:hypothetical protein